MSGPASRPMSATERLWVVAEHMHPPFVNQLVLEAEPGASLSEERLAQAVGAAAAAHPGTRLRSAGALGWARWVDDAPLPPVLSVDGSAWSGRSPAGAAFLQLPLPAATGPTTGVLRVEGDPLRLVIRSHHATMDGGGTHLFARDLFRALRGEPLEGSTLDPTVDVDIARSLEPPPFSRREHRFGAPTGVARGRLDRTTWLRRTHTGSTRRLLPRLAVALHTVAQQWTELPLSLSVPVDLRRHRPELRSTANLTGAVFLDLDVDLRSSPHGRQLAPDLRLAELLAERAAGGEAGKGLVAGQPLRWLPLSWLVGLGRHFMRKEVKAGRYPSSGVISNLGRMDLAALSCPGFAARTAFWIPPASEGQRLFLTMTGGGSDGVELCCTMAEAFASDGRLEALMDGLIEALEDS